MLLIFDNNRFSYIFQPAGVLRRFVKPDVLQTLQVGTKVHDFSQSSSKQTVITSSTLSTVTSPSRSYTLPQLASKITLDTLSILETKIPSTRSYHFIRSN